MNNPIINTPSFAMDTSLLNQQKMNLFFAKKYEQEQSCKSKLKTTKSKRKPCKANQVRNRSTRRCRKKSVRKSKRKPCKANQVRNRSTGRCRKKSVTKSKRKPCKANQVRNRSTGRCRKKSVTKSKRKKKRKKSVTKSKRKKKRKKSVTKSKRKPCKANQVRNRSTGRCRKKSVCKTKRKKSVCETLREKQKKKEKKMKDRIKAEIKKDDDKLKKAEKKEKDKLKKEKDKLKKAAKKEKDKLKKAAKKEKDKLKKEKDKLKKAAKKEKDKLKKAVKKEKILVAKEKKKVSSAKKKKKDWIKNAKKNACSKKSKKINILGQGWTSDEEEEEEEGKKIFCSDLEVRGGKCTGTTGCRKMNNQEYKEYKKTKPNTKQTRRQCVNDMSLSEMNPTQEEKDLQKERDTLANNKKNEQPPLYRRRECGMIFRNGKWDLNVNYCNYNDKDCIMEAEIGNYLCNSWKNGKVRDFHDNGMINYGQACENICQSSDNLNSEDFDDEAWQDEYGMFGSFIDRIRGAGEYVKNIGGKVLGSATKNVCDTPSKGKINQTCDVFEDKIFENRTPYRQRVISEYNGEREEMKEKWMKNPVENFMKFSTGDFYKYWPEISVPDKLRIYKIVNKRKSQEQSLS